MFENLQKKFNQKGAMALSSVLALSTILLALGLAMAYSGFIQSDIAYNQDKAAIAFYLAEAGAKDAMQKVVRNKNYSYANPGYDLIVGSGSAKVIININGGQTEILSTGTVGNNTKKVRVILNVDNNGKTAIDTWEEMGN